MAIDFDLPQARGAVQPTLSLQYSSAGTYGVGGLGWSLGIPSIERHNPSGPPQFQNDPAPGAAVVPAQQDHFTFGGEPLVEICFIGAGGTCTLSDRNLPAGEKLPSFATSTGGWHYYRLQTETGSLLRFFWSSDHMTWVVQSKDGGSSEYGKALDQSSTAVDTDANGYVFRWDLVRRYDSERIAASVPANPIVYVWTPLTAGQGGTLRYLTDLYDTPRAGAQSPTLASFAHHTHLAYSTAQTLPGASPIAPVWLALPVFLLTRVDVASQDFAATGERQQVRRYHLTYNTISNTNGTYVQPAIQQVQLEGNCTGAGNANTSTANNFELNGQLSATAPACQMRPATTFSYLPSAVTSLSALAATGITMPSLSGNATSPLLFDINNDGLPDVLDTQATPAAAWINAIGSGGTTTVSEGDTFTKAPLTLGASVYDLNNINQLLPGPSFATGAFQADGRIDMLWRAMSQATPSTSNTCSSPATPGATYYCDSSVPYAILNASQANGTWTLTPVAQDAFLDVQTRFPDFNATDSTSSILNGCPKGDFPLGQVSDQPNILGGESPLASFDLNGDGLADSFSLISWGYLQTAQVQTPFESTNYCEWEWPQYAVRLSRRDFSDAYYPFNGSAYAALPPPSSTPAQPGARTDVCIGDGPTVTYVFGPAGTIGFDLPGSWSSTWSTMALQTTPADVDGDGIMDLVNVSGQQWWPGHGDGVFGMCPGGWGTSDAGVEGPTTASEVQCACNQAVGAYFPWSLPAGSTVYGIHDVTGDGLADMVVAVAGGVSVYANLGYNINGSVSFATTPVSIPANSLLGWSGLAAPTALYFADMDGSGVDDIIVQEIPAGEPTATLLGYLDLFGHDRPGLLTTINGYDLQTQVTYASTPELEVAAGGWTTHSPQSLHAVTSVTTSDTTGDSYTTSYTYWNPAFDGRDNQFLGYGRVRTTTPGSASMLMNTDTTYFYGVCGANAGVSCAGIDYPLASYRGLPTLTEVSNGVATNTKGADTYLSTTHHSYATSILYVGSDSRRVRRIYETQTDTFLYDTSPFQVSGAGYSIPDVDLSGYSSNVWLRGASAHHLQKKMTLDLFGNVQTITDSGDLGDTSATPADPVVVASTTWYLPPAVDPGNNWIWRPQVVSTGASASDPHARVTTYAHDAYGNLTDVTRTLVGTAVLLRVDGASGPVVMSQDGAAHVAHVDYDPAGTGNPIDVQTFPASTTTNAFVRCTQYSYDEAYSQLLTTESTNVGGCNSPETVSTQHSFDRVLEVEMSTIAPNGAKSAMTYDWFARLLSIAKPDPNPLNVGQTLAASTMINYVDTSYGQLVHTSEAAGPGYAARDTYVYADGFGRTIQVASTGDGANQWVVSGQVVRDPRGRPVTAFVPNFATAADGSTLYSPTPPNVQATGTSYDAFNRVTQTTDIDGTVTSVLTYHALSTKTQDAEEAATAGLHIGAYVLTTRDGHGRTVQVDNYGNGGDITTKSTYQATGEVVAISRSGTDNSGVAVSYSRSMSYDTMGRLVGNVEPNTSSRLAWTYAYDDVGDLVGTMDARQCGENRAYDGAGRLLSEDYAPCSVTLQNPYTAPSTTPGSGDGTEAYYVYEGAALQTGQLSDVYDRASHVHMTHDGRGRLTAVTRQLAQPGIPAQALASRYSTQSFTAVMGYDERDRIVTQTTGTDLSELNSSNSLYAGLVSLYGPSTTVGVYSPRGALEGISSSYGDLVKSTLLEADGRPDSISYADPAQTTTSFTYGDSRRRLTEAKISRAGTFPKAQGSYSPPVAGSLEPTQQTVLADDVIPTTPGLGYDRVNNPLNVTDQRIPGEWVTATGGYVPVGTRTYSYDDSYRVTGMTGAFADSFVPPVAPSTTTTSPFPMSTPTTRTQFQTFSYDGMGNLIGSTDDSQVFFDRSLGAVTMGNPSNATGTGPNQLISATLPSSTSGNSGGTWASYDAAGNLVQLQVERNGKCTAGAGCNQLFQYDWDEVGNLARARRFDFVGGETCIVQLKLRLCELNPEPTNYAYPALPTTTANADVSYAYDAGGTRVLRASTPEGATTPSYSAEIFPSLRLNDAQWLGSSYEDDVDTEAVYLMLGGTALGRVVYNPDAPNIAGPLHVYLQLTDSLGSTTVVIDKDTSELVERTTYLAYGALDSDYEPARWQNFREDYKFTGKEGDVEIGLTYFGARYYSPQLGRWVSPDPLAIHGGGGDLNPYAYVRGRVTTAVDLTGLDDSGAPLVTAPIPDPTGWTQGIPVNQGGGALPAFLMDYAGPLPDLGAPELGTVASWAGNGDEDDGASSGQGLSQTLSNIGIGTTAFLFGAVQGLAPGGILTSLVPLPEGAQTPLFQYWMGAGQMTGGLMGVVGGAAGVTGGLAFVLPSLGTSTVVTVASVAAVANGITAIAVGAVNMQMAAAKGGGGSTARASSPPNDHHVFPQEFRKWFSARGVDIDKYQVELPENVHLDQLHARNIDTSAGPMNFGPGGIWNENWRQFIGANPNATAGQIMDFGRTMCAGFGIAGCP